MFARKAPMAALLAVMTLAFGGLGFQSAAVAADDSKAAPTASERETGRKNYEQIIRVYGIYEDQSLQDYVNAIGQNLVRHSHMPNAEFHFTILDTDDFNAFATEGGYVYVHRGLLAYLNSEAELAAVMGHEIGHVTGRHMARGKTQTVLATLAATAAAIYGGSEAAYQLANLGGAAWVNGYTRTLESEADRLGIEYAAKTGYRPEAAADVFRTFQAQERFERDRAKEEHRDPHLYHGVFSDHPAPDARMIQAIKVSANFAPAEGQGIENRDEYLHRIDGLPFGSSRRQGILRDNRFYHAELGISLAFPKGWIVANEPTRLLARSPNGDSLMQMTQEMRPDKLSPREYVIKNLRGSNLSSGEELKIDGYDAYSVIDRRGSPFDEGSGPVRYVVIYKDKFVYIFAGASRSSSRLVPAADRVFVSVAETFRRMRPAEYPLAEPYRLKLLKATANTRLGEVAKEIPMQRKEDYPQETVRLLNGFYPKGEPKEGQLFKTIQ
jgi:predicted Zn-dependent protease